MVTKSLRLHLWDTLRRLSRRESRTMSASLSRVQRFTLPHQSFSEDLTTTNSTRWRDQSMIRSVPLSEHWRVVVSSQVVEQSRLPFTSISRNLQALSDP